MRARIFGAAKYVLYPAFYLFCLFTALYLTFPWDKLKERIEAEFAKSQEKKGARAWRLEIESLSGYWLTGVEIEGARIIMPPDEEDDDADKTKPARGALSKVTSSASRSKKAGAEEEDPSAKEADEAKDGEKEADKPKPPTETTVLIEEAHARVRMLPLVIGRVRLDFSATVFGGEISGMIPFGGGDLELAIDSVNLAQVAPLKDVVSVPLKGIANGKLELSAEDGKWSKASGNFSLTVTDMSLGDGKSKFRKLGVTMTPAEVGTFEIAAKAEQGTFKFEKFGATGKDVELAGEGTLKLREPWDNSVLDLWLRFGFSEEYKNKDDRTKALFVDDGPFPALISQDRKLKKALRPDGLWGFNIKGKLARLAYIPTKADSPKSKAAPASGGDDDESASSTTTSPSKKRKVTKKKSDDDADSDSGSASSPMSPATSPAFRRPPGTINRATPMKMGGREDPTGPAAEGPIQEGPVQEAPPPDGAEPPADGPAPEGAQEAPQEEPQPAPQ
ncbi:MAG: type II secretion system protein GspN [Polyangiaceae bacterium]|nr:type II secretion system protein GspN [Polyangiaceae bacterium]